MSEILNVVVKDKKKSLTIMMLIWTKNIIDMVWILLKCSVLFSNFIFSLKLKGMLHVYL